MRVENYYVYVVLLYTTKVISNIETTKRSSSDRVLQSSFSSLFLSFSFDKDKTIKLHLSITVYLFFCTHPPSPRFHLVRAGISLYSLTPYVIRTHPSENHMCLLNVSPCILPSLNYVLLCNPFSHCIFYICADQGAT